jgi:DNA-binding YbaB/EbfC family protein
MKQVQEMQERVQKEIAALEIEATAGGGMVKVVMDGSKNVKSLKLDPEVVSKDDVDAAGQSGAINEAGRKVDRRPGSWALAGGEDPGLTNGDRRPRPAACAATAKKAAASPPALVWPEVKGGSHRDQVASAPR